MNHDAPITGPIRCPHCERPSPSIKHYHMIDRMVVLFVCVWARRLTYTACPACMRWMILKRSLANLPTAHLCWPVAILPLHLVLLLRSLTPGHSRALFGVEGPGTG